MRIFLVTFTALSLSLTTFANAEGFYGNVFFGKDAPIIEDNQTDDTSIINEDAFLEKAIQKTIGGELPAPEEAIEDIIVEEDTSHTNNPQQLLDQTKSDIDEEITFGEPDEEEAINQENKEEITEENIEEIESGNWVEQALAEKKKKDEARLKWIREAYKTRYSETEDDKTEAKESNHTTKKKKYKLPTMRTITKDKNAGDGIRVNNDSY